MGIPAGARRRVAVGLPTALLLVLAVILAGPGGAVPSWTRAPYRILPLGDSITYGVSTRTPTGSVPGGYRQPLDSLLGKEHVPHAFVGSMTANSGPVLDARGQGHHEGHPGYRIDQVAADLDGLAGGATDDGGSWLTGIDGRPALYPDVVIIHLGTNDISQRYDPTRQYPGGFINLSVPTERATFVSDLAQRLTALVDKIFTLRPSTRIVLSNIVPMERSNFGEVSELYGVAVAQIVQQEAAAHRHIVFADVYHQFIRTVDGHATLTPGLLTSGGIHPTPAGYAMMAQVYARAVQAVIGN
jgi:lysophospholipase L1-like esterase